MKIAHAQCLNSKVCIVWVVDHGMKAVRDSFGCMLESIFRTCYGKFSANSDWLAGVRSI
jgi:hypothetical protein